jgi:hypothetical protein
VIAGTPYEDATTAGDGTTADNNPDTATITTTGTNRLVVTLLAVNDDSAWTVAPPPAGWNSNNDSTSATGTHARFTFISTNQAYAGNATAIQIGTISATELWSSLTLAFIPDIADYTRGNYAVLPTADANLETTYTDAEVVNVATSDNVRISQLAAGEYAIHQFKNFVGSQTSVSLTWEGQTDFSPSSSTVFLQIYNRNTTAWETIDSDNTTGTNTDFTLTAVISDLTNYKDADFVIACRIYQQAV